MASTIRLRERLLEDSSLIDKFGRLMNHPKLLLFFFFAWDVARDCILVLDKLIRKGRVLLNGCYMCRRDAETCNDPLYGAPLHLDYGPLFMVFLVLIG